MDEETRVVKKEKDDRWREGEKRERGRQKVKERWTE